MKWEYKTIFFNKKNFFTSSIDTQLLDEKINDYADKGWELFTLKTVGFLVLQGAIIIFRKEKLTQFTFPI